MILWSSVFYVINLVLLLKNKNKNKTPKILKEILHLIKKVERGYYNFKIIIIQVNKNSKTFFYLSNFKNNLSKYNIF